MPKIKLEKFKDDTKVFLSFWSQSQKIHGVDSDKFEYLLQVVIVVPNSKTARVGESFPATAALYKQTEIQIPERLGREVQFYIRDLLTRVMKNAIAGRVKTDLPKFYNTLGEN